MYLACASGDDVDAGTYALLCTQIDYDGMLDIIEMKQVHASWKRAFKRRAKEEAQES